MSTYLEKIEKRKMRLQNKEKLIEMVVLQLQSQIHEYEDFIFDLCRESLMRRTNKELKELL